MAYAVDLHLGYPERLGPDMAQAMDSPSDVSHGVGARRWTSCGERQISRRHSASAARVATSALEASGIPDGRVLPRRSPVRARGDGSTEPYPPVHGRAGSATPVTPQHVDSASTAPAESGVDPNLSWVMSSTRRDAGGSLSSGPLRNGQPLRTDGECDAGRVQLRATPGSRVFAPEHTERRA